MRKLFMPLLAAIALPISVNAETVWLILFRAVCSEGCGVALEKIEMSSMEQCHKNGEIQLSKGLSADRPEKNSKAIRKTTFKCLKGK